VRGLTSKRGSVTAPRINGCRCSDVRRRLAAAPRAALRRVARGGSSAAPAAGHAAGGKRITTSCRRLNISPGASRRNWRLLARSLANDSLNACCGKRAVKLALLGAGALHNYNSAETRASARASASSDASGQNCSADSLASKPRTSGVVARHISAGGGMLSAARRTGEEQGGDISAAKIMAASASVAWRQPK